MSQIEKFFVLICFLFILLVQARIQSDDINKSNQYKQFSLSDYFSNEQRSQMSQDLQNSQFMQKVINLQLSNDQFLIFLSNDKLYCKDISIILQNYADNEINEDVKAYLEKLSKSYLSVYDADDGPQLKEYTNSEFKVYANRQIEFSKKISQFEFLITLAPCIIGWPDAFLEVLKKIDQSNPQYSFIEINSHQSRSYQPTVTQLIKKYNTEKDINQDLTQQAVKENINYEVNIFNKGFIINQNVLNLKNQLKFSLLDYFKNDQRINMSFDIEKSKFMQKIINLQLTNDEWSIFIGNDKLYCKDISQILQKYADKENQQDVKAYLQKLSNDYLDCYKADDGPKIEQYTNNAFKLYAQRQNEFSSNSTQFEFLITLSPCIVGWPIAFSQILKQIQPSNPQYSFIEYNSQQSNFENDINNLINKYGDNGINNIKTQQAVEENIIFELNIFKQGFILNQIKTQLQSGSQFKVLNYFTYLNLDQMSKNIQDSNFIQKIISKDLTENEFYIFLNNDKLYCKVISDILFRYAEQQKEKSNVASYLLDKANSYLKVYNSEDGKKLTKFTNNQFEGYADSQIEFSKNNQWFEFLITMAPCIIGWPTAFSQIKTKIDATYPKYILDFIINNSYFSQSYPKAFEILVDYQDELTINKNFLFLYLEDIIFFELSLFDNGFSQNLLQQSLLDYFKNDQRFTMSFNLEKSKFMQKIINLQLTNDEWLIFIGNDKLYCKDISQILQKYADKENQQDVKTYLQKLSNEYLDCYKADDGPKIEQYTNNEFKVYAQRQNEFSSNSAQFEFLITLSPCIVGWPIAFSQILKQIQPSNPQYKFIEYNSQQSNFENDINKLINKYGDKGINFNKTQQAVEENIIFELNIFNKGFISTQNQSKSCFQISNYFTQHQLDQLSKNIQNSNFIKKIISKDLTQNEFNIFLNNDKLYCKIISEILLNYAQKQENEKIKIYLQDRSNSFKKVYESDNGAKLKEFTNKQFKNYADKEIEISKKYQWFEFLITMAPCIIGWPTAFSEVLKQIDKSNPQYSFIESNSKYSNSYHYQFPTLVDDQYEKSINVKNIKQNLEQIIDLQLDLFYDGFRENLQTIFHLDYFQKNKKRFLMSLNLENSNIMQKIINLQLNSNEWLIFIGNYKFYCKDISQILQKYADKENQQDVKAYLQKLSNDYLDCYKANDGPKIQQYTNNAFKVYAKRQNEFSSNSAQFEFLLTLSPCVVGWPIAFFKVLKQIQPSNPQYKFIEYNSQQNSFENDINNLINKYGDNGINFNITQQALEENYIFQLNIFDQGFIIDWFSVSDYFKTEGFIQKPQEMMSQQILNSNFIKRLISKYLSEKEFYIFLNNDKLYCKIISDILLAYAEQQKDKHNVATYLKSLADYYFSLYTSKDGNQLKEFTNKEFKKFANEQIENSKKFQWFQFVYAMAPRLIGRPNVFSQIKIDETYPKYIQDFIYKNSQYSKIYPKEFEILADNFDENSVQIIFEIFGIMSYEMGIFYLFSAEDIIIDLQKIKDDL